MTAEQAGADSLCAWGRPVPPTRPLRRRIPAAQIPADEIARLYVNFTADEGEATVRAAYGTTTYERLAAVKARYDPENVFCLNQNIRPANVAAPAER